MYEAFGLLIDGRWCPASDGRTLPVIDPADGVRIGSIPAASDEDLDRALASAAAGFQRWSRIGGWDRARILREMTARLRAMTAEAALLISRETGKSVAEAEGEFNAAADVFDWHSDEARRIHGHSLRGRDGGSDLDVEFEPVGPVAAFTAWNFPALLPARKIAPALAAGCSIILKPSEEAPGAAYLMARAALESGVPEGAFNIVTGDPARISACLIPSPVIRKVTFTGSTAVGRQLLHLAADGIKRVSMELGGNAPVLVFEDCDPIGVAEACVAAKFRNAGQVCISPSRFLVHSSVHEAFADCMAEVAKGLRIGRGTDPGVQIGPMATARGRDRALDLIQDAVGKGARLLAGGRVPPSMNSGFFLEPTVLDDIPDDCRLWAEEPFAPIAGISVFDDEEDAVARANATPFGLAAYVFTASAARARRVSQALEAGMIGVNDMALASAEIPFGGVKQSGMGREGGLVGMRDYLEPKYIKSRFV